MMRWGTGFRILRRVSPATIEALDELSARETEILAYMAEGYTNPAICNELWLSPKTVETHIRSIFMKLCLPHGGKRDRRVVAVLAYLHRYAA